MMRHTLVLILTFLLSSTIGNSQTPFYQYFAEAEGLVTGHVYHCIQDRDGFLWFATSAGVSRYDGYRFTNFDSQNGLSDNEVLALYEDHQGRIWFETFSGVPNFYYRGKIYNPDNFPLLKKVVANEFIQCVFQDSQDRIWIGTNREINCLDMEKMEVKTFEGVAGKGIWEDAEGVKALISGDYYFNLSLERCVEIKEKVSNLSIMGSERLFFVGQDSIVFKKKNEIYYNKSGGKVLSLIPDLEQIINSEIIHIGPAGNGSIIVCTRSGAYLFPDINSPQNHQFFLPGTLITSSLIDHEGGIWFTTFDGVYHLVNQEIQVLETAGTNVKTIKIEGDKMIAGYNSGEVEIFRIREDQSIVSESIFELKNPIRCIALDKDDIYVGHDYGLYLIRNNRILNLYPALSIKAISILDGFLYVATSAAILKAKIQDFSSPSGHDPFYQKLNWKRIFRHRTYCLEGNGKEIFAGTIRGLFRISGNGISHITSPKTIQNVRISSLGFMESKLLVGTAGKGLWMYDNMGLTKWLQLSGLQDETIFFTRNGPEGTPWVISNEGLKQIKNNRLVAIQVANKVKAKGNQVAMDTNGRIFLATREGIRILKERPFDHSSPKPQLKVTISDVLSEKTIEDGMILNPKQNHINLDFTGISFSGVPILFRYRLSGANEKWEETYGRKIRFSNLSPGDYHLTVQVYTPPYKISQDEFELKFSILPSLWKNPWFQYLLIIVLLSLFLLSGFFWIKRSKRLAKERFLNKLKIAEAEQKALQAQMNPHFIFNSLNSIQNLIVKIRTEEAYAHLGKFSKLVRAILQASQSPTHSLEKEIKLLNWYLELESLRFDGTFEYHIDTTQVSNLSRQIPGLIIQPFVENALLHGLLPASERPGGQLLSLVFKDEGQSLIAIVEDNGVGRSHNEGKIINNDKKSLGIQIARDRLTMANPHGINTISIKDLLSDSGDPIGTRVTLKIA